MTLSPLSFASVPTAVRILAAASLALGTAATAEPKTEPAYSAQLAKPTDAKLILTKRMRFHCREDRCVSLNASSAPMTACRKLAGEAGPLVTFMAFGSAFDRAAMDECNTAATD